MERPKLTYANVMSTLGVFLALGGTSYAVARSSIGERELKDGAVTSRKVRDGAIHARDLASDTQAPGARGPRGAQGPAGAVGATGAAGPQGAPGPAQAEPWKPFPLAAGWTHLGGSWDVAKYRKDQFGVVHLSGVVTFATGTPTLNALIGTLPAGYRPTGNVLFVVSTGEPANGGRINVGANGQVAWFGGNTGETDYTSLSGVSFATD